MQVLITTGTTAGTAPIYLPYGVAPVPFGDPLACTLTYATPTVVTVPGYNPTNGDAVSFSVAGTQSGFLSSLAGLTSISMQLNTTYYVSSASGQTFTLSTQKASAATPAGVLSSLLVTAQVGQPFVHLLSNQPDGTLVPFESGGTVLAMNGGAIAGTGTLVGDITLFGASDKSTTLSTGTFGAPLGPNTFAVIATIGFGRPKLVTLSNDWIVASGSTSTLILIQN